MSRRHSPPAESQAQGMGDATRILMAEDSDRDAELVLHELKRAGLKIESRRVQTEPEFRRALDEFQPEIILSDFSMPGFGGVAALKVCREVGIEVPFIFVSGTIGEDMAVEAMKAGADDYVMKTNLLRLGPTVRRALREATLRRGGRLAESALRRAQAVAKLAHVITRPDGSFESWSDTFSALMGLTDAQTPRNTRDWLEFVHPDDRAQVRAWAIEGGRTGKRIELEYRLKGAGGSWNHIRQVSEPLSSATEAPGRLRWFGTLQDVSEQKRAAEAVVVSEVRYRSLFDRAAIGIAHSDLDGRFVDVNPRFCEMTGYTRAEALELGIRNLTHPDHLPMSVEARAELLAGAIASYERETRLVRKDGTEFWTQITTSVVSTTADGAKHFLSMIRDISERRRADQVLALEHGVARQLADAGSAAQGLQAVMRLMCESERWEFGRYWQVDAAAGLLRLAAAWGMPGIDAGKVTDSSRDVVFGPGDGLVGKVWQSGEPLWVSDIGEDLRVLRKDLRAGGLRGAFVAPVMAEGKVIGVIAFSSREIRQPDDRLLAAMRVIGGQIGQFLRRKQGEDALVASEERLKLFVQHAPAAIAMFDMDMRYLAVSTRWLNDYRLGGMDIVGRSHYEVFPEIPERWREMHRRCLAGAVEKSDEDPFARADGTVDWVKWEIHPWRRNDGTVGGIMLFSELVTERRNAAAKIGRLNRVYAVLSGINSLIVRVRDRAELFKEACRIAVEHGGFGMAWIGELDQGTLDVTPVAWSGMGEDTAQLKASARGDLPGGQGMVGRAIRDKKPVITNDINADPGAGGPRRDEALRQGLQSIIAMPLMVEGEVRATLTLFARERNFFSDEELKLLTELAGDISFALDHIEKREKLNYLAYYDQLTGLANPTLFHERLTQHVHAADASKGKLAVVVADVERFRTINDSMGRVSGDALLVQIARRLARAAGPTEVARIGADQFAVLLPEVKGRSEIGRAVEEIWRSCLDEPFELNGMDIRVALKGGIALYPNDGIHADTLFRNAEAAWKKAKKSGDRYLFHAPAMTARVAEKLALENKLREALEKEEFVLHYQPKVELESRRIVGVEALIRWQSPERGLVPPGLFIPLLEETGQILAVGAWALRRAALDHRLWLQQGLPAPRIAVNVSQIQMRQRDFVDVVREAIAPGADPAGIDLEITESLLMEDIEGNIGKLKSVRDLGLKIAIDDFGTGYSSLAYLAQLPVHTLKIDRSFIIKMLSDPNTMTLVQTIISLAHSLRLSVVAEGVEQEDQAKMLRLLRCDEMQGYLFSKPVPMEQLIPLLRGSR